MSRNNMRDNMRDMRDMRETEEFLYPDVYRQFAPIAEQLIRDMEKHGEIFLNEELLGQMIEEAIRRAESGENMTGAGETMPTMAEADGSAQIQEEAVPVMYQFGRDSRGGRDSRRRPNHGGHHWRGYDRGALSDIFRILFLQQIFGRRRPHWRFR